MSERATDRRAELYRSDLERHFFEFEAPHRGSDAESTMGDRIKARLEQLPELYREVVVLRGKEGLTYAEIAQRLGLPLGTVKSRLHRARAALRQLLDELEERIEAGKTDRNS